MDNSGSRVVLGVGRSPGAYQALRYAVGEARRRAVPLLAVRAYWSTAYNRDLWGEAPAWAAFDEAGAARRAVGSAFAEALGGFPPGVPVEIIARDGTVGRVLVSAAERENDVLVLGGRSSPRWSPRSVADFCVRRAVCPVIVVPPPALARARRPHRLAREVEDVLR